MIVNVTKTEQTTSKSGKELLECTGITDQGKPVIFLVNSKFKDFWGDIKGQMWSVEVKKFGQSYWLDKIDPYHPPDGKFPAEEEVKEAYHEAVQSKSAPVKDKMSVEDWAEKDRVTRRSIERQKSAELTVNLMIAGKTDYFKEMADKIYEWVKGD